eukprot:CAMPEP_0172307744 /NCGR_PEP_ID=MMETSP1058-20130122/8529_1 /TAXON_ID=83371 /ORGANISM="Detonula confervacea, Strain CCMP 353" /LENGTH=501 /DNA_ID=CAMNT_0013019993 /DNA_START=23 /DNA_END=1524 /DNA_ORIENTATION=+
MKKRKMNGQDDGAAASPPAAAERQLGEDGTAATATELSMVAKTKAQIMAHAQNNDMDSRLSQIDELQNKCQSMRNEMDGKRSRLSRVDELENRCSHLERSMKVLVQDQRWEYSARPIPYSYWVERGYDEDEVDMLDNVISGFEKQTCKLRRGEERGEITLGNNDLRNDESETVLPHGELLLPHWQEFTNALQLYHQSDTGRPFDFEVFSICNIQLSPFVLDTLTQALKMIRFERFVLARNDFVNARKGVNFAIEFMQNHPGLSDFSCSDNPIDSMEDMNHLLGAINSHPSLKKIYLENCCGESVTGHSILCSLLTSDIRIKRIFLPSNNIRTMGSTHLSDFLAGNPSLEYLELRNNHLDDNDAALIAEALQRNTNLRHIDLEENDITDVGSNALKRAIFPDSSGMNSNVANANHTCYIHGIENDINNFDLRKVLNIERKIYFLMSSRNRQGTNVLHLDLEFGDDSLKLAPKVLECVHRCWRSNYVKITHVVVNPLSIIYEV